MTAPWRPGAATLALGWGGALLFLLSLLYFLYSYAWRFDATTTGPAALAIGVNLALFSMFALHHSALARTGVKAALQRVIAPPIERSLYTWVASLLFIGVCAWWRPVNGVLYRLPGVLEYAGYAVQLAGVLMAVHASATLDALDLAGVRPVLDARSGREPRHVPLKVAGLYSVVRHPLYFAWALLVFGAPVMTGTRLTFAVISTLYLAAAIPFEERSLVKLFGAEYEAYRRHTRWRMLPGLY